MKYSSKLWNHNYINYDLIMPENENLKEFVAPVAIVIGIPFFALCGFMLCLTIPIDLYLKLKRFGFRFYILQFKYKSIK